jgi:hypothetical protein
MLRVQGSGSGFFLSTCRYCEHSFELFFLLVKCTAFNLVAEDITRNITFDCYSSYLVLPLLTSNAVLQSFNKLKIKSSDGVCLAIMLQNSTLIDGKLWPSSPCAGILGQQLKPSPASPLNVQQLVLTTDPRTRISLSLVTIILTEYPGFDIPCTNEVTIQKNPDQNLCIEASKRDKKKGERREDILK